MNFSFSISESHPGFPSLVLVHPEIVRIQFSRCKSSKSFCLRWNVLGSKWVLGVPVCTSARVLVSRWLDSTIIFVFASLASVYFLICVLRIYICCSELDCLASSGARLL